MDVRRPPTSAVSRIFDCLWPTYSTQPFRKQSASAEATADQLSPSTSALIFVLDAECLTAQESAAQGGFQDNTVYVEGDIGSAPKGGTEAKACAKITLLPQSLDAQITPRSPHVCAWQRTRKNGTRGENTLGMCGWASTSWVSVDAASVRPCTMPATQQKRVRIYTGRGMGCSIAGSAEKAKASLEATI